MNALIYVSTVLLWGFSWYALAVQAAFAPSVVAVFHRIALAAAIMMGILAASGAARRRPAATHLLFAAQGFCLFGANFVLFYAASRFASSGLLAVCLATAAFWNAGFAALFFGQRVAGAQIAGAAVGLVGLGLIMTDSLGIGAEKLLGLGLGLGGAVMFSLGNMASIAVRRAGAAQIEGVAWGMLYGAAGLGLAVLIQGESFALPLARDYLLALGYLSVFASAIAFSTYLALVARLGAARAAYATVLFPVVALAVSAALEDYRPSLGALLGLGLILAGAALTLGVRSVWGRPGLTFPR